MKPSILNPLKTIAFLGRKPISVALEPRPAEANYRGFHLNDWQQCIGCRSCQKICDNQAITMIHISELVSDAVKGIRAERPAIDYGRCCWCGLCVDVCPSGSLSLSREYVHVCNGDELDSYFVLPDPNGIHNQFFEKGWTKTSDSDLLELERQPMSEIESQKRVQDFSEIVSGYTPQEALLEASRCVQCGLCHDACPTNMHAPEYIRAIWENKPDEAVRQIYRSNPFAQVCGRVCTHRCESACAIGVRGQPIAIRWLKRYAMDALSLQQIKQIAAEDKALANSGYAVAIIGAGPSGLTAAFDLVKQGHRVTVFEALDKPGGMARYGIPEYRLPYDRLDADIEVITSLGVEIRCNTRVGTDISMAQLESDFDAILVGIGLQQGRSTRIPGCHHEQVQSAVALLRQITKNEAMVLPKSVVVIGGGNVAMDMARSLARLQKQQYGEINVTVTALETLGKNFLADSEEITEAQEEGIVILDARGPKECIIDSDNHLTGLNTVKVLSIFDESGRFAPKYDEQDSQIHAADMVVEAIGQMSVIDFLGDALIERLEWDRGRLQVDEQGRTSLPWLWAAGDMVHGPDVIHAVADGHRVAESINHYLQSQAMRKVSHE